MYSSADASGRSTNSTQTPESTPQLAVRSTFDRAFSGMSTNDGTLAGVGAGADTTPGVSPLPRPPLPHSDLEHSARVHLQLPAVAGMRRVHAGAAGAAAKKPSISPAGGDDSPRRAHSAPERMPAPELPANHSSCLLCALLLQARNVSVTMVYVSFW